MGIFNFDLNHRQARQETQPVKPTRRVPVRPVRPKQFKNSLPSSPRGLEVDLTLTTASTAPSPTPRVPDVQLKDLGVVTHLKEQVLLVKHGEQDSQAVRLAKPIWPKSNPTIPSTFFKGNFQTQVEKFTNKSIKPTKSKQQNM